MKNDLVGHYSLVSNTGGGGTLHTMTPFAIGYSTVGYSRRLIPCYSAFFPSRLTVQFMVAFSTVSDQKLDGGGRPGNKATCYIRINQSLVLN